MPDVSLHISHGVNYWHVLAITFANFFLSWAWYSPLLFAKPWMNALGLKGPEHMTEEDKKKMPLLFGGGLLASFLLAYTLARLVDMTGARDFESGALLGLLCCAGFAVTGVLNSAWEGKKGVVMVINIGLYAVSYSVFGGILAVW